ncbi:glycosyltransferase [Roseomonas sp. NAR14]|uniref:Glycosyltransferase n=1 Tax=Roseomonas acroporae TaxID=2937791 RepID=A0A9X2BTN2_9PROT|nr:glycosyltransferase [Roseomonas acroporae]MCK8784783.1 glycosyltransferase [Roseomonas acroporae]
MKIAIIAHLKYPISDPFQGGLEMHTHLIARHLIARGHEVTLHASEGSDPALGLCPVGPPTGTPRDDREEHAIALAEAAAYAEILRRIAAGGAPGSSPGGCDLVLNNSLHYLPLLEAHRIPAPMVTAFHCPPFHELENGVAERSRRDLRFVAVSGVVRGMWERFVAVDEVIPNGIDLDLFAARLAPGGGRHAIWSGRLVPEKGPHLAIAAARLAGVPLRIAGPRSDPAYWAGRIAPALGDGIEYVGHLDHRSLAREVAEAAVAVVTPCWEEPYGLVVAEALACGTPVAGFARGALPDLTDAATGRLAPADDLDALARAIREAMTLSRPACRARAEAMCDAQVMMDRYEALFRAEIDRHARSRASVATA